VIHNHANTARTMMMKQRVPRLIPLNSESSSRTRRCAWLRSAKRFKVDPACSNTDQRCRTEEEDPTHRGGRVLAESTSGPRDTATRRRPPCREQRPADPLGDPAAETLTDRSHRNAAQSNTMISPTLHAERLAASAAPSGGASVADAAPAVPKYGAERGTATSPNTIPIPAAANPRCQ
jgi:hypothetical protein